MLPVISYRLQDEGYKFQLFERAEKYERKQCEKTREKHEWVLGDSEHHLVKKNTCVNGGEENHTVKQHERTSLVRMPR